MISAHPAPFILLDDASLASGRGRDGARPCRLYRDPVEIIVARNEAEVLPALDRLSQAPARGLHAAGYIAYEAGFALDTRLSGLSVPASETPLLWFGLFAQEETLSPQAVIEMLPDGGAARADPPEPLVTRAHYEAAFNRVQDHIRAGDIYQANLTFPSHLSFEGSPLALYARLRERAQAGFGGIVFTGTHWLLSFSPEKFFSLDGRTISTRPMKGTAARQADAARDAAMARALASDPKQRAENLMIVDLLRNDLSRVSVAGSVHVPELFQVETYPTVHQMVSEVQGQLLPGLGPVDILRALFPCGSITGAPKLKAMEIIAATEGHARGIYTGSIGRMNPGGDAAFNVAIRTICVKDGAAEAVIGLGSGVVADSLVEAEWKECLEKGKFLTQGD